MAFKKKVRNKLRVPVKGEIKEEDGTTSKFDFTLLCDRIEQSAIDAEMEDKGSSFGAFLHRVVTGWEGIVEADGTPTPFSTEELTQHLEIPAMRTVCFQAYMKEVGAVAKN